VLACVLDLVGCAAQLQALVVFAEGCYKPMPTTTQDTGAAITYVVG
jgi:hypothetical protein